MPALDQINQGGTIYEIVPEIAELFKTTKAYHTGDHVIYEAGWYTFKADKSAGAWDATKVDGPFKVTDQLSDLKEDLNAVSLKNLSQIDWTPTLLRGRYIRLTDGKNYSSAKYAITTALWYGKDYRDAVTVSSNVYEFAVIYYDATGDTSTGSGFIGASGYMQGGTIAEIPYFAIKFCISFRRSDQSNLSDDDITAISNALICYQSTAKNAEKSINGLTTSAFIDKTTGTIKNAYIGISSGKILTSVTTVKTLCLECLPNTIYKVYHPLSTRFVIGSYDKEPVTNLEATKWYDGRDEQDTVFTTSANAKWLAIYYYSGARNTITPEETYDALSISTVGIGEIVETVNKLVTDALLQRQTLGFYTSNDSLPVPSTFDAVIELYDELVSSYPNYVTKNTLSSGNFTNYEYVFTSGNYNRDSSAHRSPDPMISKPVILLTSGIHGDEKSAVIALYKLMSDLCNNDYALVDLINYVTIKVIPVGCPWGYTNNSRLNENGVNINRNFATSTWGDYDPGEPGSSNYAGPSAGSENETKVLQAWMDENHDALFYVDFHNSGYTNEVAVLLGSDETDSVEFKKKYLLGLNKIIPYWQSARKIDDTNNYYCYTGGSGTEGRVSWNYAYEAGITLGYTHETSWNVNNTGKHSQTTLNVGAEAMGNFLIGMKDYYKEI